MPVTTAWANSFKQELFQGIHLAGDAYMIALIKTGAVGSFDKTTTNYSQLGADEVVGAGYAAGGMMLSGYTAALTGDTASIAWLNAIWPVASISAIGALIYNNSRANRVLQVINFADTGATPVVRLASARSGSPERKGTACKSSSVRTGTSARRATSAGRNSPTAATATSSTPASSARQQAPSSWATS